MKGWMLGRKLRCWRVMASEEREVGGVGELGELGGRATGGLY